MFIVMFRGAVSCQKANATVPLRLESIVKAQSFGVGHARHRLLEERTCLAGTTLQGFRDWTDGSQMARNAALQRRPF